MRIAAFVLSILCDFWHFWYNGEFEQSKRQAETVQRRCKQVAVIVVVIVAACRKMFSIMTILM